MNSVGTKARIGLKDLIVSGKLTKEAHLWMQLNFYPVRFAVPRDELWLCRTSQQLEINRCRSISVRSYEELHDDDDIQSGGIFRADNCECRPHGLALFDPKLISPAEKTLQKSIYYRKG